MTFRNLLAALVFTSVFVMPAQVNGQRPLQAYSIMDAGAKCDGVTDDSDAVQRALDTAKIITVSNASNYCIVNSTITIPAGRTIKADASGINFNAAANCFKSTTLNGDMFRLAGGSNTIDGACFVHDGPGGKIINDVGRLGHNRIRNSGFGSTNTLNLDHLVYFDSSDNGIENSSCSNGRPARGKSFCLVFDATGGKINIENYANHNIFAAPNYPNAGPAVYVGSMDASARNEGFHFHGNRILSQSDNNIFIEALLFGEFFGNSFDQGHKSQVVLAPNSRFAVAHVSFVGNWFSTPIAQKDGVCLGQRNAAFRTAYVNLSANHFAFCGFGAVFSHGADRISFIGNDFSDIGTVASQVEEASNVTWIGNQYRFIHGSNLNLADGPTGGPFSIGAEQYDPEARIEITKTSSSKFSFGATTGRKLSGTQTVTKHVTTCIPQSLSSTLGS